MMNAIMFIVGILVGLLVMIAFVAGVGVGLMMKDDDDCKEGIRCIARNVLPEEPNEEPLTGYNSIGFKVD